MLVGLMGNVGRVLGPIIATVGAAITRMSVGILGLVAGMAGAGVGAWHLAERLTEADRALAAYNGRIAIAYTQLAIGDFHRNVDLAGRAAPTTTAMVQAVNGMRNSFQEWRVVQTNIGNQTGTAIALIQGQFGRAFAPLAGIINHLGWDITG